jgi:hypothetical protein
LWRSSTFSKPSPLNCGITINAVSLCLERNKIMAEDSITLELECTDVDSNEDGSKFATFVSPGDDSEKTYYVEDFTVHCPAGEYCPTEGTKVSVKVTLKPDLAIGPEPVVGEPVALLEDEATGDASAAPVADPAPDVDGGSLPAPVAADPQADVATDVTDPPAEVKPEVQ